MLRQWCTNVMRSRVAPMKAVAKMIRRHFDGIVAWTQTRQTNGFIEALNGLLQAAKRKARGYTRGLPNIVLPTWGERKQLSIIVIEPLRSEKAMRP